MRYIYELRNTIGYRIDITTNIAKIFDDICGLKEGWTVSVLDNLKQADTHIIRSRDELEEWSEVAARSATWSDKSDKEKLAAKMGKDWKPFNDGETDIHLKTAAEMTDKPLFDFGRLPDHGSNLPDANLKTIAAIGKPTFHAVPVIGYVALGQAMQNGEDKYERFNWRTAGSTSSVFFDAMLRHLLDWYCGEDHAADSKIHHLAHLMAGSTILLDSELHGKLNDDRDRREDSGKLIADIMKIIKK